MVTFIILEDIDLLQEDEGVGTIKSQSSHTNQVTKKQVRKTAYSLAKYIIYSKYSPV